MKDSTGQEIDENSVLQMTVKNLQNYSTALIQAQCEFLIDKLKDKDVENCADVGVMLINTFNHAHSMSKDFVTEAMAEFGVAITPEKLN